MHGRGRQNPDSVAPCDSRTGARSSWQRRWDRSRLDHRYEAGAIPPRRTLEALVSAVACRFSFLDACLLPVVSLVAAAAVSLREAFADLEAATAELDCRLSTLAAALAALPPATHRGGFRRPPARRTLGCRLAPPPDL